MGNQVHDTAVIGPGVDLGEDNVIGPYAVITGPCRIGDRNWIGAHAVLGAPPEVRGRDQGVPWGGEPVSLGVEIADDNTLREFTTVHGGTWRVTRIGSRCFVMNKVYVAHDSVIGDDVTLAANATLAGHVEVGSWANVGLSSAVHQYRVVGPGAMVGMGAVVTRDVPPFAKVVGSPARVRGVNDVGMRRRGFSADDIGVLAEHYGPDAPAGERWVAPTALQSAWEWWRARTSAD
jgi:UDP-N-acetylglucosamine acyltransferase